MLYLNALTNDASQLISLTGIPGKQIRMTLQFMPRIQQWVMGVSLGDFTANGIAVVSSVNLLRQWRNEIPFGIAVIRSDGLDPYTIDDFVNQLTNMYLLNADDVEQVELDWFT